MQKLFGRSASQPANQAANDEAPWLFVTAARTFATFTGILTVLLNCLGLLFSIFSISSLALSIGLIIIGLVMILLEAPFFFAFWDLSFLPTQVQQIKNYWVKATLYLTFSIVAFYFDRGTYSLFTELLIFLSSAFYLMLALGKKASLEEMAAKAVNENPTSVLVNNEVLPENGNSAPFYKNNSNNGKNLNFTSPPPISNPTGSMVY